MPDTDLPTPSPIPELDSLNRERFEQEVLPAGRPVVIRGLVRDWPIVRAGLQSDEAVVAYLRQFDSGNSFDTAIGPPSTGGRLFYNDDLSALNFRMGGAKLQSTLDYILSSRDDEDPPAVAIQSVPVRQTLPGYEMQNRLPLLDPAIEPRIWIGNRVIIAAHHDPSENIACVAAGRRRFTLFPPDQIGNLYIGPLELTPAGAVVSMVSFDAPELDKYPRFPEALAHAQVADLEPGDAIYIPYLWWHHVRSLAALNILVNYWWSPPGAGIGKPRQAMLHAMLALNDMTPAHRDAWRAHFEHYVFGANGDPGEHLPENRRGILGEPDPETLRKFRTAIVQAMSSG